MNWPYAHIPIDVPPRLAAAVCWSCWPDSNRSDVGLLLVLYCSTLQLAVAYPHLSEVNGLPCRVTMVGNNSIGGFDGICEMLCHDCCVCFAMMLGVMLHGAGVVTWRDQRAQRS